MSRDEPTQYDIEALDANVRRVGLVIRLRWVLVLVLTLYSITAAGVYMRAIPFEELVRNLVVPGVALVFVLAYNAFYQATYRHLGNIAILNHAQLMFDVLVVGVLVYYSGGVYSWFHAMFLLFILEGAFILPRERDAWIIAGFAALVYGGILLGQYYGWLSHVPVPFVANDLYDHSVYVGVRMLWVFTVLAGAASISSHLMSEIHEREARLAESVITDEGTGLCNRNHFHRVLKAEIRRARRSDGLVGVVLLDIRDFSRFNETFGYPAGNRMIKALAQEMTAFVDEGVDADADLVTVCRCGGEEFALVVPGEPPSDECDSFSERIARFAEHLHARMQAVRVEDIGVSISAGVVVFPSDGSSFDDIMDAVDQALSVAAQAGDGCVVRASGRARGA